MKKIYLLASFLGAATFAFNQANVPLLSQKETINQEVRPFDTQAPEFVKAPGDTIWESDFSDPSKWTTGRENSTEGNWVIGTFYDLPAPIQNGQAYYRVMDTSSTNNFAFFDGLHFLLQGASAVQSQNAWVEMANSIDLSSDSMVAIKFEQRYRAFNSDVTYVEISLDDGATWEQAVDPNPNAVNTYADRTIIRLVFKVDSSSTVKFRFRWESILNQGDNPLGASGYCWQVDNVVIYEPATYDVATSNLYYSDTLGYTYHRIPNEQIRPIVAQIAATNKGIKLQKNVKITATESGSGYTGSSLGDDIMVDSVKVLAIPGSNGLMPTNNSSYSISYTVTQDSTDLFPSNNEITQTYDFTTGGFIFAADSAKGAMSDAPSPGTGWVTPYQLLTADLYQYGVIYHTTAKDSLYGIDFQFGPDTLANNSQGITRFGDNLLFQGRLLEAIPGAQAAPFWKEVASTPTYVAGTGAEEAWQYHTFTFDDPIALEKGKDYLVAIVPFSDKYGIATCGLSQSGQIARYIPQPQGQTPGFYGYVNPQPTPIIRMNFDPNAVGAESHAGTVENSLNILGVNQYPNPFSNETNVDYVLQEGANVSYSIVDLAGNVIATGNQGNQTAGSHSFTINGANLANGIYFLQLKAGHSVITKKLVVQK